MKNETPFSLFPSLLSLVQLWKSPWQMQKRIRERLHQKFRLKTAAAWFEAQEGGFIRRARGRRGGGIGGCCSAHSSRVTLINQTSGNCVIKLGPLRSLCSFLANLEARSLLNTFQRSGLGGCMICGRNNLAWNCVCYGEREEAKRRIPVVFFDDFHFFDRFHFHLQSINSPECIFQRPSHECLPHLGESLWITWSFYLFACTSSTN